jgi:predicted nucleotidyltransferase
MSPATSSTLRSLSCVWRRGQSRANPESRTAFLAEFAERRREMTRLVLRRAIQRGELRANTDIDLVIDALGGATTFRLLQGHAPLTTKFAHALVTLVLSGCRTAPAPQKENL